MLVVRFAGFALGFVAEFVVEFVAGFVTGFVAGSVAGIVVDFGLAVDPLAAVAPVVIALAIVSVHFAMIVRCFAALGQVVHVG